ncbi:uncharacterized protein LOC131955639 [Physella acuta]|uniref:uncharacterized protein LOC131955639 n=1 Tax=Physella acuta TaxID=109671 RepID=UPI0027DADD89|nr:uncharacterized protein LOC131955639 [Physella acuta]XP_059175825.1 uncharacterized protein LOC131955639 [Physella acuta]XP_059175832.1 uncharacterized protein LOC131955639 [Physella acuta]XP_059175841.1 uncharacterized protein LOC131955639 [Physella acuta]
MDVQNLKPDRNGLYSVCVPIDYFPQQDKKMIENIFSKAGLVKRTNFSQKYLFVRYGKKEEVVNAVNMFGKRYHAELANASKKEIEYMMNANNDTARPNDLLIEQQDSSLDTNTFYNGQKTNQNRGSDRVNGNKVNGRNLERNTMIPDNCFVPHVKTTASDKPVTLYISNIESEMEFRELIKPYQPESVNVIKKQPKKIFAYVEMSSDSAAKKVIEDLNHKEQREKTLLVDYKKNSGHREDSSPRMENLAAKQVLEMPQLEVDYSDIPALIHASTIKQDIDELNFRIFVANFPSHSLESTLRKAFAEYHVRDICLQNNVAANGCTKALLYLATIYDVLAAVKDMNGSCILGMPLKVAVPYRDQLLQKIVGKVKY